MEKQINSTTIEEALKRCQEIKYVSCVFWGNTGTRTQTTVIGGNLEIIQSIVTGLRDEPALAVLFKKAIILYDLSLIDDPLQTNPDEIKKDKS